MTTPDTKAKKKKITPRPSKKREPVQQFLQRVDQQYGEALSKLAK